MIDVRVHRNFPLNCIKLIIVVLPAWCPVFCLQVLGMTELLEVLEDKLDSPPPPPPPGQSGLVRTSCGPQL